MIYLTYTLSECFYLLTEAVRKKNEPGLRAFGKLPWGISMAKILHLLQDPCLGIEPSYRHDTKFICNISDGCYHYTNRDTGAGRDFPLGPSP